MTKRLKALQLFLLLALLLALLLLWNGGDQDGEDAARLEQRIRLILEL